jgi:hypothetical protein
LWEAELLTSTCQVALEVTKGNGDAFFRMAESKDYESSQFELKRNDQSAWG